MYNTADNLEDLDMVKELLSYETVSDVAENHQIFEEEFQDADFQIFVLDFSEIDQIKELLLPLGYTAYIEDPNSFIKIEN